MLRKQLLVFGGMALAVAILVLLWGIGPGGLPLPDSDGTSARLAFAARWLLLPGFCLMAGIAMVANRRFFVPDAMDGTRTPASRSLEVNLRYNQNTLEQVVLAAIAWTGLALALPFDRLSLIPALAILFVVARALFWFGYLVAPWARALGFALTFYPTVAAFIWLGTRLLAR
ncbi:MAG: MAPEG family protein [Rhizomicrobium sp.]|jgi:hypothetical protein